MRKGWFVLICGLEFGYVDVFANAFNHDRRLMVGGIDDQQHESIVRHDESFQTDVKLIALSLHLFI